MTDRRGIWVGWDPRECDAFAVARESIRRRLITPIPIHGLVLSHLRSAGLYHRPTSIKDGRLWDDISEAPMSTEFAISRFLVPHLAQSGWALFLDADMLARKNVEALFSIVDPTKAVMVVKHNHQPAAGIKMDGQVQTAYPRKNWSSVMLFNVDHPANKALTPELINSVPGRDLHRFCWLQDDEIGELPVEWNWLVGHSEPRRYPSMVHFTDGIPSMAGHADDPYSGEWRNELERWALGGLSFGS